MPPEKSGGIFLSGFFGGQVRIHFFTFAARLRNWFDNVAERCIVELSTKKGETKWQNYSQQAQQF